MNRKKELPINTVVCGDALEVMKEMPSRSIDMAITSPPYWGLRDYGTGPDQLGLEPTPEMYIEHLTEIFNEVKRVLKKEGTLWLNIGDTYSASGSGACHDTWSGNLSQRQDSLPRESHRLRRQLKRGLPPKCLCMIPERLAWALIQNGWILRNKIIWYKPNAMPSSVTDRFSNRWEYLFMFSRSQRYYFDLDAVREAYTEPIDRWGGEWKKGYCQTKYPPGQIAIPERDRNMRPNPEGKNPGDVIKIKDERTTKIPEESAESFGSPRARYNRLGHEDLDILNPDGKNPDDIFEINTQPFPEAHFAVFPEKLCEKPIKAGCPEGGIVLDPFCGAGTALLVAKEMKRRFIGIDIKQEYCDMCEKRLAQGVL